MPGKNSEPFNHLNNQNITAGLHNVSLEGGEPLSSSNRAEVPVVEDNLVNKNIDEVATNDKFGNQDNVTFTEICKPAMGLVSGEESSLKLSHKAESMCGQEKTPLEKTTEKVLALHHLREDDELLREAMRMALDKEHSFSSHIEQLNEQIAARKRSLQDLEKQWDIDRKSLEDKKWNLIESICVDRPDCQRQLQKMKEIDQEMHSVLSELRQREVECTKLESELEKQPKIDSRRSYIQRITEITKNSRKLDMDIEQILKDTRELKLESNSIEERLHRTYAVVDETFFREAKKDPVCRQAYRQLANIHECFENIQEQIFAADKIQREVAELEVKLLAIASRSLDEDKLQADLDAMRRENEHLEKTLLNYKSGH